MARTEEARQKVGDLVRSRGNTTEARMADELIASLEGGEGRLPAPPSRGRSPPRGGPGGGRCETVCLIAWDQSGCDEGCFMESIQPPVV